MDYIKQLEEFYSSLDYNSLSSNAIVIYGMLLHIAYKAGWIDELSVANTTLENKCNINTKQLQNGRNELISKNYIIYKKGRNQNIAPKYNIIRLYKDIDFKIGQPKGYPEGQAEGYPEGQPDGYPKGYINITKLNILFNILINNSDKQKGNMSEADRQAIIVQLKRLEIFIPNMELLKYFSKEQLLEYKIQYWTIYQIYHSPYKTILRNITRKQFLFRFYKAKEYMDMTPQNIEDFIKYFIRCLQKEFEKGSGISDVRN